MTDAEGPSVKLSATHLACLRLVGRGYSSKKIALELGLAPNTIDTYCRHAIRAFGVVDRVAAARALERLEQSQELRHQSDAVARSPLSAMLDLSPLPVAAPTDIDNRRLKEERALFDTGHEIPTIITVRRLLEQWLKVFTGDLTPGERAGIVFRITCAMTVAVLVISAVAESLTRTIEAFVH
ncbi:response regulator transcription factor [uncultured Sphingomonas sp.]|uniref:response regulator transcription factor n=1 Tax=uncultured Sphingomonas sp. TaxID=158754 RepID=UPI0035C9B07E